METFHVGSRKELRKPKGYLFTPSRLLWSHLLFWIGGGIITLFENSKIIILYYCLSWLAGLVGVLFYWVIRSFFRQSTLLERGTYAIAPEELIRKEVVVMIPAYNEEESIEQCIHEVRKYVDRVVVVNDGSTDRTAEFAERAGAIVIHNSTNMGLAFTFKSGAQYIAGLPNVKAIVNFDADLQYDAADIPELVSPIFTRRVDLMMGSRLAGSIEHMPKIKYFGNKVFTILLAILTGVRITDGQSGFRAFTPELISTIKLRPGFTYTQQMIVETAFRGFKIKEIPIHFAIRQHGESRLMRGALDFAIRANKLLGKIVFIEYFPLQVFGLVAMILTIGFMGMASGVIASGFLAFVDPLYWASFIGSFAISVIGYLKIYGKIPGLKFNFNEMEYAIKNVEESYFEHIDGRMIKEAMELSAQKMRVMNDGKFI